MNHARWIHIILCSSMMVLVLVISLFAAPTTKKPQDYGEQVGGLQMAIYADQGDGRHPETGKFRVEFRNAGDSDLVLNLGFMLANGKSQYASAVLLILTDAQGVSRRVDLSGHGLLTGRLDPLVLPLPVNSIFSIPVDLGNYRSTPSQEFDHARKSTPNSIEAQFVGTGVSQQMANLDVKGFALMPYWLGTVVSNEIPFTFTAPPQVTHP